MERVVEPRNESLALPATPEAPSGAGRPGRVKTGRRIFAVRPRTGVRHFSIRSKVFVLLLAQSLLVVAAFSLLIAWAFSRGFAQYMTHYDDARAQDFVSALKAEYARDGTWEILKGDALRWDQLAMTAAGHTVVNPGKLRELFEQFQFNEFPESIRAPLPLRFVLMDANKRLIIGKVAPGSELRELPIRVGTQVVGTLAFPITSQSPYDYEFRNRMLVAVMAITVISVLLATLPALFIARSVTRPVSSIGRAARTLAAGSKVAPLPVESNDELGDLARDFNELSSALERNKDLQRQWLADISHELRTPVQILMAETEAVIDGMRTPSREAFKSLYDESHRLARLIDDLHNLSLLDAGIARLRPVVVDLSAVVRGCVAAEQTRFTQREIRVNVALDPNEAACTIGDADKLRQVIMNLLENSLRYTDAGGEVRISVVAAGDAVHVRFEDSSPGVAEHEIPHLFERLYRSEASRNRASGGAGLGLAIVQSIVEAHGGRIVASPSALGGLRFDIEFRRAA